ncbi:MAG: prepilin-type N-terminal cleavage/methylation domain-containing protein [Planctomycetota bacterium]
MFTARAALPRGFTLIELLVVVAIVSLLIGILLPALASARDSARSVVGLSRLRDLAQASRFYADDNGGEMTRTSHSARVGFGPPRGLEWYLALARYFDSSLDTWLPPSVDEGSWLRVVNEHYRSPTDRVRQEPGEVGLGFRPVLSYAQSVWFELRRQEFELGSGDASEPFRRLDALPFPTRTVLFAEMTEPYLSSLGPRVTPAGLGGTGQGTATDHIMAHFWKLFEVDPQEVATPTRGPLGGYVFVDGHAEIKRLEETFSVADGRDLWDPRAMRLK